MKKGYLPYGYIERTQEQIEKQERKIQLYEYYGIPYGVFDDGQDSVSQKDIDRAQADLLIEAGRPIPVDLAERLLEYKKDDERNLIKRNKEIYSFKI